MDDKQLANLVAMFKEEAADHISALNRDLLALERSTDPEERRHLQEEIFREAHSLKGAARATGFGQVQAVSHHMESVLGAVRQGEMELTADICDILYEAVDLIEAILSASPGMTEQPVDTQVVITQLAALLNIEPVPAEAPAPTTNGAAGREHDETIRVSLRKIEGLMAQAGELLVSKINAEQRLSDLKAIRQTLTRRDHRSTEALIAEMRERITRLEKMIASDTMRLGLVTSNIQDGIRQARMLPFSTMLAGFERMVRDLARSEGKQVQMVVTGSEVELDKYVLEELRDPLMHLLRNAVAHGIERPGERAALGKPREGTIHLTITHKGSLITVDIADDGRGLDLDAVEKAATANGIEDAAAMPADQLTNLVLLPGISTIGQVTELAGRGVGLDVVRQQVQNLHGQIGISSQPGHGATFTLTVPVSLATTRGLLVRIGGETYAIPLTSIDRVLTVSAGEIRTTGGREIIPIDGRPAALAKLIDVLQRPMPDRLNQSAAGFVLRTATGTPVVFLVDELMGEQELVVKGLGKLLTDVPNVAGATLLGTGEVVVILDPADLLRSAQGQPTTPVFTQEEQRPQSNILVVDDSITTRTLEKNILEAAGYHVATAIDGTEAVAYLHAHPCDLVVSDIEMPHMNGFELTRAVREQFGGLPLILVTSLESQDHRRRGLEAGADAYIVKNAFDQEDLLLTIEQLLGRVTV